MPKKVVSRSGRISKTASSMMANPKRRKMREGLRPDLLESEEMSGIWVMSLSTLVRMDCRRGFSYVLIFKYRVLFPYTTITHHIQKIQNSLY